MGFFYNFGRFVKLLVKLYGVGIVTVVRNIGTLAISQNHSEYLNQFIRNNNVKSFLEIGVNEGVNIFYLAKKNPEVIFYGVDPYYNSLDEIAEPIHGLHKTTYVNDKYKEILDKVKKFKLKNVFILKNTSVDAAAKFAEKSLDCVFIDGLHSYDNVVEDINYWLPIIKNDGYLLGHDFSLEWFSVVRAVEDTLGLNNILVDVYSKVWIFKKD